MIPVASTYDAISCTALRTSSMAHATVGTNAAEPQTLHRVVPKSELVCYPFSVLYTFVVMNSVDV